MQKKDCIEFEQVVERGCGMDVHKETVVVTILGKGIKSVTKSYSKFTSSLIKLKKWLKKHSITHIAMESTGVYWKPVFNVLGDDFVILLVNARHMKNIPGHKILTASYFIIKDNVEFKELGEDHLKNFRRDKLIAYHKKQIERLDPNLEFEEEKVA